PTMAHSLSPKCTPLKHKYDACFNAWFEGYLERAVSSATAPSEERQASSRRKAGEYEASCWKIWTSYWEYVQVPLLSFGSGR
ncbi:hypothetical protein GLOTRDRAFT_21966, partial [Gloeophyllum trabeum ATCC 11539]